MGSEQPITEFVEAAEFVRQPISDEEFADLLRREFGLAMAKVENDLFVKLVAGPK